MKRKSIQLNHVASAQMNKPEKGLLEISTGTPLAKKAELNFESWCKRQKLDFDKIRVNC